MSLINPVILYGAVLAIVPIILHLLLRSKPKKLVFPALRLIDARRRQNVRRLRLKHLWLLVLRIALLLLLVLALARPSLPAANYSLTPREWGTVAAIAAVVGGAYSAMLRNWKRQGLPRHTLVYRRAFLRGGAGLAAAVLLALFVAWPYQRRIAAEISSPLPQVAEQLPVAAVFLFDTSLSMEYQHESKTRLEVAQTIAVEHLNRLPSRSRIAVADTSSGNPILFQADLASAQSRIEGLRTSAVSQPLDDRLLAAFDLQQQDRSRTLQSQRAEAEGRDAYVREIYVFTDLARTGWRTGDSPALREALDRNKWVSLYLIDVGVPSPVNIGLRRLRLSDESLPRGGKLYVETHVTAIGVGGKSGGREEPSGGALPASRSGKPAASAVGQCLVELYVQSASGKMVKQGQESVPLDPNAEVRVQFVVDGLTAPLHRGEVRLQSTDPFTPDNVRYFTVRVRPPTEVLLVGPTRQQTEYLDLALAPTELVRLERTRYRCRYASPSELAQLDLSRYQVVCLISVPELSAQAWRALTGFVRAGGGLAVFLGTHGVRTAVSYNSSEAQAVLPAELVASLRFTPPEFLDLRDLSHPVFKKFERLGGAVELATAEVRRFWKVTPQPNAHLITRYTDPDALPAILERLVGAGRVVLVTTAIDLRGWSDLPRAGWQYVAFADQLMSYLVQAGTVRLNYIVGETAQIPIDPSLPTRRYLLRKPGLQQLTREVPPNARMLTIDDVDQIGHYEVVPSLKDADFLAGFSANGPDGESDFGRMTQGDLDQRLGEGRYSVARDIESLTRRVATGRLGVEVFPILFLLLLAVFLLEQVVSNWFYEDAEEVLPKAA